MFSSVYSLALLSHACTFLHLLRYQNSVLTPYDPILEGSHGSQDCKIRKCLITLVNVSPQFVGIIPLKEIGEPSPVAKHLLEAGEDPPLPPRKI